ncbi:MAG: hypothetical protein GC184_14795 [Rhizobiales bacterium]|nr:hypothetical protein [Hyphomicrobiales bacterium]
MPKVERQKVQEGTVPGWTPELGRRLSSAIDSLGGLKSTGKIAGYTDEQVGKWRDGKAKMPFAAAIAIAEQAGRSLDWLAGLGNTAARAQHSATGMVAIPILNVAASAGPGLVALDENPVDHLWFNAAWLRQTYGVNPSDLKMLPSTGDSMVPTIPTGAMLMVNTGKAARLPGDGIFVVRLEGDILVKRLQRVPGGKIKVSSDNPAYDPFHINLDDGGVDFALLGRVVVAIDLKRL